MNILPFLKARENYFPLFILIALLFAVFFLWEDAGRSYRAAREAADNAQTSKELARRIIELKKKPELISGSMSTTAQIAQSVEAAMTKAEIPAEKLVRIEPRSAKRIEKTPFMEQPSHLELRDITLEQLIRFLHTLSTQNHLETTDLRLHAPRTSSSESGSEVWNAELLLTNIIYFP